MNIAVVFPSRVEPHHLYKDPGLIVTCLREIGHRATLLSPADGPLDDEAFWRRSGFDAALVYTWMSAFPAVVEAIKASGTVVVQKGDTDGMLSVRTHPRARLARMVASQRAGVGKARAVSFWARLWLSGYRQQDAEVIANIARADATIVETEGARANLGQLLHLHGRDALTNRIFVVPNPADTRLWHEPIQKTRRIVAVGRWDDPQKDVQLLVRTLRAYVRRDAAVEVVVMGAGGKDAFRHVAGSRVHCLGAVDRGVIAKQFAAARILLFSSRWEGMPVALSEALTLGCTAVCPPLPTIASVIGEEYGRVAITRATLADALAAEMRAWDQGIRDPQAIAAHFRARLSPAAVARQVEQLITVQGA